MVNDDPRTELNSNHWMLNKYSTALIPSFLHCIQLMRKKKFERIKIEDIFSEYKEVKKILKNHRNTEEIYFAMFYEYVLLKKYTFRINLIEPLKKCVEENAFNEELYRRNLCKEDGSPTVAGINYYIIKYGSFEKGKRESKLIKMLENYIKPKVIQDKDNPSISYLQSKGYLNVFNYNFKTYGIITTKGQLAIKGNKRIKDKNIFLYPIEEYFLEQTETCTHP